MVRNDGGRQEQKNKGEADSVSKSRLQQPLPQIQIAQLCDTSELSWRETLSAYLALGWSLVPLDRKTDFRATPEGDGQATKDLNKALRWSDADFGIAVATGKDSGIVALRYQNDFGKSTLEALQADFGERFVTAQVRAFPHDYLLLFRAPEQELSSIRNVAPGLDLLAKKAFFSPLKWDTECTVLSELPDSILSLATKKNTYGYSDLVARGNLAVLNDLTLAKAAKVYHKLGLQLIPVNKDGVFCTKGGEFALPELWVKEPETGIGIETGSRSGVVGLWLPDRESTQALEKKYGPLSLPQIWGPQRVLCFRAPSERFPSQDLFNGIEYVGEDDFLPVPPSKVNGVRLIWQVAKDFSSELPDLPHWLRTLLTDPEALAAAQPQPQEQTQKKSQQKPSHAKSPIPTSQLGKAALSYAENQGWLVFRLPAGGKAANLGQWQHKATKDRKTVKAWWEKTKNANIAVMTGVESAIVVLDVDVKEGKPGLQTLAALEEQHGRLDTLRARTTTNGLHLFFRAPAQKVGNKIGFLPGLDFKGQNGYVVLAPSRVGDKEYRWEDPNVPIAELPDWLLTLVSTKTTPKGKKTPTAKPHEKLSYGEALAGVQEGTRNDTIFRLASKLRHDGWDYDEAEALVKTAAANCQPPLPEDEALRCLDSAWTYEPPLALSDMGNAERFVARCGDRVRYLPEKDYWLVWSRHWWQKKVGELYRMAKSTIRSLRDEAAAETDPSRRRLLFAHGRKSENPEALERMLQLAGLELAVSADDLDRPGLIAFANGVLDQSTGTLRPGRRGDLLTKHAKFPYDPDDPQCHRLLEPPEPPSVRRSVARTTAPAATSATPSAQTWAEKFDEWLAERCEVGPAFSEKAQALRDDISAWADMPVSDQRFGRLIRAKGFVATKSNSFVYHGLRLRR